MINLMPPAMKEQIRYGKLNRIVLGYLRLLVVVLVVLAGLFGGAYYLINQQYNAIASDVTAKTQQLNQEKRTVLPEAQDASQRLSAIAYVQQTQTNFSQLIADLANLMPVGVQLQSITLNGNAKAPVSMAVSAPSYDSVLALRNSLATSPRLAGVDIVSISSVKASDGTVKWNGTLVLAFNAGKAQ